MDEKFRIREAVRADVPVILELIRAIAEYEKMSDCVTATEEIVEASMFDRQEAHCILAEYDGKPIGFALYFYNFSTFVGKAGLYLEDLFVYPEYRGRGYGKKLLTHLAKIAVDKGCERYEWICLDWNKPSIDFYLSIGAVPMSDWTVYRLSGDALKKASGLNPETPRGVSE